MTLMNLHWIFKHLIMVAILVGSCILGAVILSRWCGSTRSTSENAYQVAGSFAVNELNAEGSIDHPSFDDSFVVKKATGAEVDGVSFIVSSYIEVTNELNQKSKHSYKCELNVSSGNLWTLVSLN